MTIVPRTGPLSAISARAITSWYQRGKSSARDTIAPLLMAAQVTGVAGAPPTGPGPSTASLRRCTAVNDLDLRGGVIGIATRGLEKLPAIRLRLRLRPGVGRGEARLGPFGHQALRLLDESPHHPLLGNDAHDLAAYEEMPFVLARRNADVGFARLSRSVDHAAHNGDLNGKVELLQCPLRLLGHRDHVHLGPAAGGTRNEVHPLALTQAERFQQLATGPGLFDRVGREGEADSVADALGQQGGDPGRALHQARRRWARLGGSQVEGMA